MNQPKTVMLCSNNMVIVFDAAGNQIPEYQGRYEEAAAALLHAPLDGCEFLHGDWVRRTQQPITQSEFFNHSGHTE